MENNEDLNKFIGFLDPILLEKHYEQLRRFSTFSPEILFEIFYKIRNTELKKINTNSFYQTEINTIKQNIKNINLQNIGINVDLNRMMNYFIKDCYIWLYVFFLSNREELFKNNIVLKNENYIKDLKQNKGCILGQLHFGPFQMTSPILANLKYELLQIFGEKEAELWAKNLMKKYTNHSEYFDTTCVHDKLFIRLALKSLEKKKLVLLPLEVNGKENSPKQKTTFLNEEIYAPDGAAKISYMSKCPIIIVYSYIKDNTLIIEFEKPIYIHTKEEIGIKNKVIFELIEEKVKNAPNEWRGWGFLNEMLVN